MNPAALSAALFLLVSGLLADSATEWRQWRGPLATGEAPTANPPLEWSENRNIAWRVPSPGQGQGSPVIAGDTLYLLTADPVGPAIPPRFSEAPGAHDNAPITHAYQFALCSIDTATGALRWRRVLKETIPADGAHVSATLASRSAIADDSRVYAFFGSQGLYCLNHAGEIIWRYDLGQMHPKHGHGEGGNPVLHDGILAVNWDHEGQSFVVAFNAADGREIWRQLRDEPTSWASPVVTVHDGRNQLIISGTNRIRAYDLATGEVIWACGGLSNNVVASPVVGNGIVFAGSSYEKQAMLAIRLTESKGDITGSDRVVWQRNRRTPYVPSPLLYRDTLYVLNHYQNILLAINAATGEDAAPTIRLNGIGNIYASPVAAAGHIFITDLNGATIVLKPAPAPDVVALNQLNDSFAASAGIAGNAIYFRGEKSLYKIAATPEK